MPGSTYMDKCFAGDYYGLVPAPLATSDPSCDPAAQFIRTKRVPSPHAGAYDPYCEVVTSYGITKSDGQDIGWLRVDHEGSCFDPNSTITKAVVLNSDSSDITAYSHVWPRIWNDPLGSSTFHKENTPGKADKLRHQIALICAKRPSR